jgi:CHAT domain-containing protein
MDLGCRWLRRMSLFLPTGLVLLSMGMAPALKAQPSANLRSVPMQGPMATLMKIREFRALRDAGKLEEATKRLQSAIADMEGRGEIPILLLPTYAQTLLKLDRVDEAIDILKRVRAAEEAAAQRPSVDSMNAFDAMTAMETTFGFARSQARMMNQDLLIVETDDPMPGTAIPDAWPEVTLPVVLLADAYSRKGNATAAFELFDGPFSRYLQRRKGMSDPYTQLNLDLAAEASCLRFALALARFGPNPRAQKAFECALDINQERMKSIGTRSPVRAFQRGSAAQRRAIVGAYAGYVLQQGPDSVTGGRRLIEAIADSKGVAARYMERRTAILATSRQPELQSLRPGLDALEQSLLSLPTQGTAAVAAHVKWANEEAELMSRALKPMVAEGLDKVFARGADILSAAQAQLGKDALIGFSIYVPADTASASALPARLLRYAIWSDGVDVRDVGTRKEIEALVFRWRRDPGSAGKTLSQALLADLPEPVAHARSWLVDPDGALNLLPFEALTMPSGKFVLEEHVLRYVTSMATLAQGSTASPRTGAKALIVADPLFDAKGPPGDMGESLRAMQTSQGVALGALKLSPLPDTREEARGVAAALQRMGVDAETRLGDRATLEAFDFAGAPRFLHIATHGLYFVPGPQAGGPQRVRVATVLPGLQSALALTPSSKGSLLTARKLSRLPLQGTELVVLSACDTGNGSVDVGEGVASLRRAVEEAGARSVIASLWAVPSQATTDLMIDFYGRLASGMSKSEALREAKLQQLRKSQEVVNWAGFLLSGAP